MVYNILYTGLYCGCCCFKNVFSSASIVLFSLSRAKSRTSQRLPRCISRTRSKSLSTSARTSMPHSSNALWLCVRRAPGCSSRVKPVHPEVIKKAALPPLGDSLPSSCPHRLQGSKVARKGDLSRPV